MHSIEQCMLMYGLSEVRVTSFIQLPLVWWHSWLKQDCDLINILPILKTTGKWARWSKDCVPLGIGRNGEGNR